LEPPNESALKGENNAIDDASGKNPSPNIYRAVA